MRYELRIMRVLRIEQLKPGRDANIKVPPFIGDIAQGLKPGVAMRFDAALKRRSSTKTLFTRLKAWPFQIICEASPGSVRDPSCRTKAAPLKRCRCFIITRSTPDIKIE